jgi:hypothetical protein
MPGSCWQRFSVASFVGPPPPVGDVPLDGCVPLAGSVPPVGFVPPLEPEPPDGVVPLAGFVPPVGFVLGAGTATGDTKSPTVGANVGFELTELDTSDGVIGLDDGYGTPA